MKVHTHHSLDRIRDHLGDMSLGTEVNFNRGSTEERKPNLNGNSTTPWAGVLNRIKRERDKNSALSLGCWAAWAVYLATSALVATAGVALTAIHSLTVFPKTVSQEKNLPPLSYFCRVFCHETKK